MIKKNVVGLLLILSMFSITIVAQTQDDLTSAARAFVELLVKQDFTTAVAQFDDTMKTALPEPKLRETWTAVLAQAGAFKQAGKARTEKRGERSEERRVGQECRSRW